MRKIAGRLAQRIRRLRDAVPTRGFGVVRFGSVSRRPSEHARLRALFRCVSVAATMCVSPSMKTTLSLVSEIVGRLLTGRARAEPVSLDEVAEAIGAAAVTMQEIEAIFDALEAAGQPLKRSPKIHRLSSAKCSPPCARSRPSVVDDRRYRKSPSTPASVWARCALLCCTRGYCVR